MEKYNRLLKKLLKYRSYIFVFFIVFIISLRLGFYFSGNNKIDYDEIYTEYYDDDVHVIGSTRGATNLNEELSNGINYFNDKNYEDAILSFQNIKNNISVNFYLGSSYMELGDYDKSIQYFDSIIKDKNNLFVEKSEWMMILCNVKLSKRGKSILMLEEIINKGNHYKIDEARELLDEL